ncbi:hypothetical protein M433DRAFT_417505 [Acidomyces richmondensis BFW]|nr:MAG: hypothetical protein FE78DRAFT_290682 [Acidomyces sp. 'richmondensis']KYG42340.1 hypothetical protein M433DRAFT_417505 [Acidomyces richmondensis BFW]
MFVTLLLFALSNALPAIDDLTQLPFSKSSLGKLSNSHSATRGIAILTSKARKPFCSPLGPSTPPCSWHVRSGDGSPAVGAWRTLKFDRLEILSFGYAGNC